METSTPRISDLILKRIRHEVNNWVRALEQGASALGDYSSRIAHQLEYSSRSWTKANEEIEQILTGNDQLTFAQVDRLLQLMPPDRAVLRFHLERLTSVYRELCQGSTPDLGRMMVDAEAAIDKGDYEVGLGLLERLLRRDPHFYPALLLKGVTLMRSEHGRSESVRLFELAYQAAPTRASERYQQVALELIGSTYQLDSQPLAAIKALKRISSLGVEDPAVDYSIARNHAKSGQNSDSLNILKFAIARRHQLISLALIDKDFSSARKEIMALLEEENESWGERSVQLLKKAEKAAEIARSFRLDKRDRSIARGLTQLLQMDKMLDQGCFSVYRTILMQRLPRWIETVLPSIEGHFQAEVQDRRDRIERHNAEMVVQYRRRRSLFLGVGVTLWALFSAIVFLLALSKGHGTLVGLISSGVTLAIGVLPFFVVNNMLKRGLDNSLVDPDEGKTGQKEMKALKEISDSIVAELSSAGIQVDNKKIIQ